MEVVDGWLTGRVRGDVAKSNGKAVALRKLMKRLNVSRRDCVVVADDRNNLPMFPMCRVRIGFNPDFLVAARADVVVRRALLDVAPIILEEGVGPSLRPPSRRNQKIRQNQVRECFSICPLPTGKHKSKFTTIFCDINCIIYSLITKFRNFNIIFIKNFIFYIYKILYM